MTRKDNSGPDTKADPFDVANLRKTIDYKQAAARKVISAVPVQRPKSSIFFRTHPENQYTVVLMEDEEERQPYYVAPELEQDLIGTFPTLARRTKLIQCVTRRGDTHLWPIKQPTDGRTNSWTTSAEVAAALAERDWIRVQSNTDLGQYETYVATARDIMGEPRWPEDYSFTDLLRIAFGPYLIDDKDHPLIKRLQGAL
jgi:hypothetical protein